LGLCDELLCAQLPSRWCCCCGYAAAKLQLLLGSGVTIWLWAKLVLRLNPSIQESLGAFTAAEAVWDVFFDCYGAATIPQVYKDFKEAI